MKKDKKPVTKTSLTNPVVTNFGGNKNGLRGQGEINPKSTFTPVKDRSGTRGDR